MTASLSRDSQIEPGSANVRPRAAVGTAATVPTPDVEIVARRQNTMGGGAVASIDPDDPADVRRRDEANLVLTS